MNRPSLSRPARVLTLLAPKGAPRRGATDPKDLPVILACAVAACTVLALALAGLLP